MQRRADGRLRGRLRTTTYQDWPRRFSVTVLVAAVLVAIVAGAVGLPAAPVAAQVPVDEMLTACEPNGGPYNPYLVTTCFAKGDRNDGEPALVFLQDTPDDSGHIKGPTAGDVGAVYGLAYHGRDRDLYVGAYHKRGTHFGPNGTGAIYRYDLVDGSTETFVVVPDAGADVHDPTDNYFPDTPARDPTGKTSLGDVDLSTDGTELTVVNLNDRRIYRYAIPGGEALGAFEHGAADLDWAEDARPFGLGYRGDKLFHGVVRSAQSSQDPDELWAFVYESNWDGSEMREVASTSLRYARGFFWPGEGEAIWQPWSDPPGEVDPRYGRYAMPLLADITFTPDGEQMILGFRDRFGDETFFSQAPTPPPPGEKINNVPAGDILPAFPDGDRWNIQVDPEYYTGDYGPRPQGSHDETSYGGLVVLPGHEIVAMTANSPDRTHSAGVIWLDTETGESLRREEIYARGDTFGKANGLGDMDVVCDTLQQPTPTVTASPTVEPTATPTATATEAATQTPPATQTAVPSATVTPGPTNTPAPGDTPEDEDEDEDEPTPVAQVTELPKLPSTGGGPEGVGGWGMLPLVALVAAVLAVRRIRRRQALQRQ